METIYLHKVIERKPSKKRSGQSHEVSVTEGDAQRSTLL